MKYQVVLLALVPLVWGAEIQKIVEDEERSLSGDIIKVIEQIKEQMPCGFPIWNVPPLAPLKIGHKQYSIKFKSHKADTEVNDLRLDGINDFDIENLKVNIFSSRVKFRFNWNNVNFTTNYNITLKNDTKDINRSGPAKLTINNWNAWGEIKFKYNIVSQKLTLKDVDVSASMGEAISAIEGLSEDPVVNKKLNEEIEKWLQITVDNNAEKMAEIGNSKVLPYVNNVLSNMTLPDILDAIYGGKGGNGEGGEPCVPPENTYYINNLY